nr:uncharacterized protein LOC120967842 [Aegilops tauschii subsp. strangulata]
MTPHRDAAPLRPRQPRSCPATAPHPGRGYSPSRYAGLHAPTATRSPTSSFPAPHDDPRPDPSRNGHPRRPDAGSGPRRPPATPRCRIRDHALLLRLPQQEWPLPPIDVTAMKGLPALCHAAQGRSDPLRCRLGSGLAATHKCLCGERRHASEVDGQLGFPRRLQLTKRRAAASPNTSCSSVWHCAALFFSMCSAKNSVDVQPSMMAPALFSLMCKSPWTRLLLCFSF